MTIQTRREFVKATVKTALSAGFALAVQPVSAQTIHTDTKGLIAGEIQIPTSDGHIPGYYARPDRPGTFPTILVVQEIFGVHEHIRDVCRRFAKHGYLAVAPELFAREGDVSTITDFNTIVTQVVSKVPDAQVMTDLDSAVAWAQRSGHGDVKKLGLTGFCWGGRIAWLYAAHNPNLKASVAWYGHLVGQPDPLHPINPLDIAGKLHCPVLGLYGGLDQGITADSRAQMESALVQAHDPSKIVVYPDAGHGFHADYRPGYNAKDAADGDQKMYAWFHSHGV